MKSHVRHSLFTCCGERRKHPFLQVYTEARGQCWLSCLSLFTLLMLLFWDNNCWTWGMWTWLLGWPVSPKGWPFSAFLGLGLLAWVTINRCVLGIWTWVPKSAVNTEQPLQPLVYCVTAPFHQNPKDFSSSVMKHWNTQKPSFTSIFVLKWFQQISYRLIMEFESKLVYLKQKKLCMSLFWGRCSLSFLKLPWLHKNQFYVHW